MAYGSISVLRVIFGAHKDSVDAVESECCVSDFCEVCYSPLSHAYRRRLEERGYGVFHSEETDRDVLERKFWACRNYFCYVCYKSEAYINFYSQVEAPHRLAPLAVYERQYLQRINAVVDSVLAYDCQLQL